MKDEPAEDWITKGKSFLEREAELKRLMDEVSVVLLEISSNGFCILRREKNAQQLLFPLRG